MRLIDADELQSFIREQVPLKFFLGRDIARAYKNMEAIIHSVEIQPTIDPVKHGQWISGCYTAPIMSETDVCSECGLRLVYGLNFKYCPECGAMNEVSE